MEYAVKTTALTKLYGDKIAVNKMSVNIEKGAIYGLIGRNGAGKTTFLKMLSGLVTPDGGSMEFFGGGNLDKQRMRMGSLIEAPALYFSETAYENMRRFAILTGTPDSRISDLLGFVGLNNVGDKKVRAFSLGMKQRLGIAIALLGDPEILVLDEPVNGLDPAGIRDIRDMIKYLSGKGVTFIISSHHLDELGKIATAYGIMNDGVLTEEISAEDLAEKCRSIIRIRVDDSEKAKEALISAFPQATVGGDGDEVLVAGGGDVAEINVCLTQNGVKIYGLIADDSALENFLISRMGR